MSSVILSHDLTVRAWNVLEPAVLTTKRFPTNQFNQHFFHVEHRSVWHS